MKKPSLCCVLLLPRLLLNSCVLLGFNRVMERDGRLRLFGGHKPGQEFDVTGFRLDPKKPNFGI